MLENLLILLIGITSAVVYRRERSWIAPGVIFGLYWALFITISFIVVGRPSDGLTFALSWVLLAIVIFQIGTFCGSIMAGSRAQMPKIDDTSKPTWSHLRIVCIFLIVSSIVGVTLQFRSAGLGISLPSLGEIAAENRILFYKGLVRQSSMEKILLLFMYASALFGWKLSRVSPFLFDKILGISPLLIGWIGGTLYGSRMGALFGTSFWLSAYLASWRAHNRRIKMVFNIINLVILAIGTFILSFITMYLRYGDVSVEGSKAMSRIGQPFTFFWAFAEWLGGSGWETGLLSWGRQTFRGVLDDFGIIGYPYYPMWTPRGTTTLGTAFMDYISDFGSIGALIWLFGWGVLGGYAYRKVSRRKEGYVPALAAVYTFVFTSIFFSYLRYKVNILAFVVFWLYHVFDSASWRLKRHMVRVKHQEAMKVLPPSEVWGRFSSEVKEPQG